MKKDNAENQIERSIEIHKEWKRRGLREIPKKNDCPWWVWGYNKQGELGFRDRHLPIGLNHALPHIVNKIEATGECPDFGNLGNSIMGLRILEASGYGVLQYSGVDLDGVRWAWNYPAGANKANLYHKTKTDSEAAEALLYDLLLG